jgi:N-acetylglucosamine kinase-like BadF-type ATPase
MRRESLVQLPDSLTQPQAERSVRYLLGVDGGATKTLAAVLDLHGGGLWLAHGGPSNEDAVGPAAAVQTLLQCADEALARSGISEEQLDAAVVAVAGTDTHAVAEHMRSARSESWIVVNDVVGAWATATGGEPGVAVIAGTGSNAFGVGRAGETWRAGGWGHLLGDEGSGYWFGIQSIKAALRDREASGPATSLSDALPAFFGVESVEALANQVYSKPLSKGEIAAFATEAARIAAAGDEVARELYERGARELGAQITTVIRMTGLDGEFPVGLIGSVYKAGVLYIDPLARAVHERSPGARVAAVEMAPVGGSLLLALRACGATGQLPRDALAALIDRTLAAESPAVAPRA